MGEIILLVTIFGQVSDVMNIFSKKGLLLAHGIHLNTILEMSSGVHVWFQHNNVNFGQEVPPEEGQDTDQGGADVSSYGEGASADGVDGEEANPGDHVHHQAEGDTLGLVVVGRQVFAHVAEKEANRAQHTHVTELGERPGREGVAALQHDAVHVEIQILGGLGRAHSHAEHRDAQDGDGRDENCHLGPAVFSPLVVDGRQPRGKFENADDLQRAHGDAGQTHGEAECEQRLLENAGQRRRPAKVAQRAEGGGSESHQHQQAGAASGRLGHRSVDVEQEDERRAAGHQETAGQEEEQSHRQRMVPFQQQKSPLQTTLAAPGSPLLCQTPLACGRILKKMKRVLVQFFMEKIKCGVWKVFCWLQHCGSFFFFLTQWAFSQEDFTC